MTQYNDLLEKRHQLQIQIAAIDKQLIKLAGDPAREILEFLNSKTGKKYRPVQANLQMIRARLKEGYTVDDLRQVVAMMVRRWRHDKKMCGYLRPKTLFSATNMANYSGDLQ